MRRLHYSSALGIQIAIATMLLCALGAAVPASTLRLPPAPVEITTVKLSPKDTFLKTDKKNYSTSATLATYTWPDRKIANAILMKFDLSSLPPGAIVQAATLNLALVASDGTTDAVYNVSAHKVLRKNPNIAKATGYTSDGATAWTATNCCQGVPLAQADISPSYDVQAINKVNGFKTWTITTMVQEWLANPASNMGLLLDSDATRLRDRYRTFASMEHANASLRPFLQITFTAADVTPPAVSISAPQTGNVSSIVPLTANASDNVAVASVQFKINGTPISPELLVFPYSFNWDTTTRSDGIYSLTAVARDVVGNATTSAPVVVSVRNGVMLLSAQDTTISIDTTANYSAEPSVMTYTWPDNKVANAILMKFDLTSLPAGSIVSDARLMLALVQSDALPEPAYHVSVNKVIGINPVITEANGNNASAATAWSPSACCHDGVPLAQSDISQPYSTIAVDKAPGFKAWNITDMAQEWLADPSTNFGLLLNSDATATRDHYRYFASADHSDASLRPVLRLTYAASSDTTPPVIAAVAVSGVTTSSAIISWTTDELADSQVEFGTTSAYGSASPLDSTKTTGHSVTLSGLASATQYHFRVRSRDQSANVAASVDFTFTTADIPPPPPPPSGGLSSLYPGDAGIENDPNVVFVERFDEGSLATMFGRWTDVLNGSAMSITNDAPAGSPVGKSLTIPWSASSSGGHLYRRLPQGVDDTLYVRYYVKYPSTTTYDHTGIWMGGYNPPLDWPNPQAGLKPSGGDRFSAAAEQNELGRFDHYDYWMGMRQSGDGSYWGNYLLNSPGVQASADQWMCVEQMVKLNSPVTSANGEHAIWINGTKVSHVGPGFPNGSWSGGIFTQNAAGTPFQGIQWRNTTDLKLNYLWLQTFANGGSGSLKYAHVVAAKSYIGCLAGGAPDPTPDPSPAVFTSNWDTATGTSHAAVTDNGRWPVYMEFNGGSSVQLLSVVPEGVNGHNALRVQQRGSSFAANLQVDNFLPASKDYYIRYYMKTDDTSSAGDHIVTVDLYNYANLTFMRKYGGATSWNHVLSVYGCGYTYPIGHWGPATPLKNGEWYRFEYFVHYVDATHVQVHPRVYDAGGNLLLSDSGYRQSDFGGASWGGRSDWTLESFYAAGNSFCVNPSWMNDFGVGNNGQQFAADTGKYWYFAGIEIRTDRWPGPVPQR